MNVRNRKTAKKNNIYESVGAQTSADLMPNPRDWRQWLLIAGKHREPNLQEYLFNFFLEFAGSFVLGLLVVLVSAGSSSGNSVLNGALTGLTYGLGYWFITRWSSNYALRRHLNWAVSFGYWWVGEIGLLGFLIYGSVQTLGALCAGAFISGIAAITQVTVPVPVTGVTTFSYALGLEFMGSFVIVFSLLLNEFYATETGAGKSDDEQARILGNNYKVATSITAGTKAVMVTAFFQMQSYTFSNVVYLTGLFSGFNHPAPRDIIISSNLRPADFANSVFTNGAAWANYVFMPLLGATGAAAVFWMFMVLFEYREKKPWSFRVWNRVVMPRGEEVPDDTDKMVPANSGSRVQEYIEHARGASTQQLAQPLVSSSLYKTH